MIGPGSNARVYLACGAVDMRKGIDGLAALAQANLRQNPASGAVFAFRGRRGDRLKLLSWDGQGFCLAFGGGRRGAVDGGAIWRCCGKALIGVAHPGRRHRRERPESQTI